MLRLGSRQIMMEAPANPYPIFKLELATPHKEEFQSEIVYPSSDKCPMSSSLELVQQSPELKASAEPYVSSTSSREECSVCENKCPKNFWFCGVCKLAYCNSCWAMQAPHRMKSKALASTPHEKTSLEIAYKVGKVLAPTDDVQRRVELHRKDEDTAWFGIERPNDWSPLLIQDYGRLNDFLNEWEAKKGLSTSGPRTPSLVSFVGQTGAGKSSLIKLLIEFASNDNDKQPYSTPVIGSRTAHLPTSEDVHLYLDPRTASTKRPILLADCEGLDGGDREPVGAKLKAQFRKEDEQVARNNDGFFKRQRVAYECELRWSITNESKTRSRGFAATHVYPRLLYAFSDVIVFVLKNHR